jgi:hypothetical protein
MPVTVMSPEGSSRIIGIASRGLVAQVEIDQHAGQVETVLTDPQGSGPSPSLPAGTEGQRRILDTSK